MIESPLIQEIVAETRQQDILLFLEGRFGSVSPELAARIRSIVDVRQLDDLAKRVGSCSSLEAFQELLKQGGE